MVHTNLIFLVMILAAAVAMVTLFRRLALPPIIGYILLGLILGPSVTNLIPQTDMMGVFAEFGVVFLLFAIGLEFSIPHLWNMRSLVFGAGILEVVVTGGALALLLWWLGFAPLVAVLMGGALSLSSTAVVSKELRERAELQSRHGRTAIGVLIFEDLAAIPLLIMIPVVAAGNLNTVGDELIWALIKGIGAIAFLVAVGHFLLRPLFNMVAKTHSAELFTLTVLLVAIGAAVLTNEFGLSLALGAFAAGLVLSETEYRHQIESDIRPFQDVLLGLFFISVGMLLDLDIILQNFPRVMMIMLAMIAIKIVTLFGIVRLIGQPTGVALRTALIMAHAGEFGFALISLAFSEDLLPPLMGQEVLAAAILSLVIAPFAIKYNGKLVKKLFPESYTSNLNQHLQALDETTREVDEKHIILLGFGRTGQTLARFLHIFHTPFVALDMDITRVRQARAAGEPVFYGDATRREILEAAHLEKAAMLIITHNDHHTAIKALNTLRHLNQTLPVVVRTLDDAYIQELKDAGATEVIADQFEAAIMLSSHMLLMLGMNPEEIYTHTHATKTDRYQRLAGYYPGIHEHKNVAAHRKQLLELIEVPMDSPIIGQRLFDTLPENCNANLRALVRNQQRFEEDELNQWVAAGDRIEVAGYLDEIERYKHLIRDTTPQLTVSTHT